LFICLCAALAGAEGPTAIARWARAKRDWLQERVDLSSGLPSHDTIARVLARLDPNAFGACFAAWTRELYRDAGGATGRTTEGGAGEGEVIALDGKTVRASLDRASGLPALHLVSAWACQSRLVLAQRKVQDHENEIVAVPDLLGLLDVRGCLVTGDALLCQKEVAAQVVAQGGDYLLALKDNHSISYERVEEFFTYWRAREFRTEQTNEAVAHQFCQTVGKGHGRVEVRRCWLAEGAGEWLDTDREWARLNSVAVVECERRHPTSGKTSKEVRYFITSLSGPDAARRVLRASRRHWGIENRLHWVLDAVFAEDKQRTRSTTGHAAENLALLSKIALNVLRRDRTPGLGGVKAKRQIAGWDVRFLETLLTGNPYEPA
jgi:predicted transposase YbfD/YdcC